MRKLFVSVFVFFAFQFLISPAVAEMYKWVDQNGVVHYSDTPPAGDKKVEILETTQYSPPPPKPNATNSRENRKADAASKPEKKAYIKKNSLDRYADRVVVFTTTWCSYCKKAIAFLQAHRIRFEQYDIEKDPAAAKKMRELGGRGGVPFAILKGKPAHGFSERTYKKALGLR